MDDGAARAVASALARPALDCSSSRPPAAWPRTLRRTAAAAQRQRPGRRRPHSDSGPDGGGHGRSARWRLGLPMTWRRGGRRGRGRRSSTAAASVDLGEKEAGEVSAPGDNKENKEKVGFLPRSVIISPFHVLHFLPTGHESGFVFD